MIGKRGSGKSFMMRDIMYKLRNIPRGIVVSSTEYVNAHFQKFIPLSYIYREFDSDRVEAIMDSQAKLISKHGKVKETQLFIILDDVLSDADNTFKNKAMRRLFFDGRHYNITVFVLIQDAMGINPKMRGNVDNVFIFAEIIHNNIKKLHQHYCGAFEKFSDFRRVLNSCTENREAMVVKMTQNLSSRISDIIFFYRAINTPEFRVGDRTYWEVHERAVAAKRAAKKDKSVRTIV